MLQDSGGTKAIKIKAAAVQNNLWVEIQTIDIKIKTSPFGHFVKFSNDLRRDLTTQIIYALKSHILHLLIFT